MLDEVVRVGKNGAKIVFYDFELLLDDILGTLIFEGNVWHKSVYVHQADLSGLVRKNIVTEKVTNKSLTVIICTSDLVHLLLSSKDNHHLLLKMFGPENLHIKVLHRLNSVLTVDRAKIEAIT